MSLFIISIILGLVILLWSADLFIDGASSVANHLKVSPLIIGMVIVGFGTSAPELLVSVISSFEDHGQMAMGNIVGSNITNIALVLGLTALLKPIKVQSAVLTKEIPLLLILTCFYLVIFSNLEMSFIEGIILLVLFAALAFWTKAQNKNSTQENKELISEVQQEINEHPRSLKKAIFFTLIGLVFLLGSSKLLVWASVEVAHFFGMTDLVIGLTILALGTSLPELASSVAAIRKNEHDMAIGNVIGSNLFNLLLIGGLVGVIDPFEANSELLSRDIVLMTALTLCLFLFIFMNYKNKRIARWQGMVFMSSYFVYLYFLYDTK
jgi:cation:H+ antiporter